MRTLLITGSALVLAACGGGRDTGEPTAAAGEDSAHRVTAQAVAVGEGMALGAGRYALLNAASGMCVDVAGASAASGAHLQQARCNRNLAQVFEVSEVAAGVYKLLNAGSGKALDIAGASTAEGASLQQWDDNGTVAQRFRVTHLGGDRFALVNAGSAKCVAVAGGSRDDGARLQQSTCGDELGRQFRFMPLVGTQQAAVAVGIYTVSGVQAGLCLDIEGTTADDGAKLVQAACNAKTSQRFEFRADAQGSYRIVARASGKSLDVTDVSTANGALLQQWSAGNGDNQRFVVSASGNALSIKARHSGKCVDVKDRSVQAGARIQQWDCGGQANQQWRLLVDAAPAPAPAPSPAPSPAPAPAPAPAPTPAPAPASADLTDARKKDIAMQLVSSAENSSLDWRAQYAYIQDIGDGRGYTAGIIGFCSGTGDMLELVTAYARRAPNNVLAKYVPALRTLNGSASHSGLDPNFRSDWRSVAADPVWRAAQDDERDTVYFNPAVQQARQDGLHALGQFIYYDAIVMHGPGDDGVSFGGIRNAALKKARPPSQGGGETAYLNAFLDARVAAMKSEEAHSDTSRVDTAQRVFLKAGNLGLDTPLTWRVYGDSYTIK